MRLEETFATATDQLESVQKLYPICKYQNKEQYYVVWIHTDLMLTINLSYNTTTNEDVCYGVEYVYFTNNLIIAGVM